MQLCKGREGGKMKQTSELKSSSPAFQTPAGSVAKSFLPSPGPARPFEGHSNAGHHPRSLRGRRWLSKLRWLAHQNWLVEPPEKPLPNSYNDPAQQHILKSPHGPQEGFPGPSILEVLPRCEFMLGGHPWGYIHFTEFC